MKYELRSKILENLGRATMCWEPRPSGVFQSEACIQIADDIMNDFEDYLTILREKV